MTHQLEGIFGELGISQYLDAFVDQGFDTWETILDITESDLVTLGVKLGHRRKIQRRIANFRGIAPDAALVSPTQPTTEDARVEVHRPDGVRTEGSAAATVIAKRKYRRHPKTDENAPERPPSAYVLFSNKMREDLKGRNLTFTEIAKLVGENWQNLSHTEKDPFETQAQAGKDKYNHDLAAYKKTSEYKKYLDYLQDFKAKHSGSSQDKDVSKRVKLSYTSHPSHDSGRSTTPTPPRTRSATGSGSDDRAGSEPPPPSREQRVGSVFSAVDSQYSPSPSSYYPGPDVPLSPAAMNHSDKTSEMSPTACASPGEPSLSIPAKCTSSWANVQRAESTGSRRNLPPLADMLDSRGLVNSAPASADVGYGFPQGRHSGSPGPTPSLVGGNSRPPSLRKEYSSAGSTSSSYSFPRTPIEGSLPIHALLLSGAPAPPFESGPIPGRRARSPDRKPSFMQYASDRSANDLSQGSVMTTASSYFASPQPMSTSSAQHTPSYFTAQPPGRGEGPAPVFTDAATLDGISALLRAREIVDRQGR